MVEFWCLSVQDAFLSLGDAIVSESGGFVSGISVDKVCVGHQKYVISNSSPRRQCHISREMRLSAGTRIFVTTA